MEKRARRWTFTLNNYSNDDELKIQNYNNKFLIYGREIAPVTGTPHLQGYIEFKSPKKFETLIRHHPSMHWEIARKTRQANINYCKKSGNFYCGHELDQFHPLQNQTERDIIEKDLLHFETKLRARRLLNGIDLKDEMLNEIRCGFIEKPRIIYITGQSGTGKTFKALQIACEYYPNDEIEIIDFANSFALINNPLAPCFVFLEFRSSTVDAHTFLQLLDGYGMQLNVKHSSCFIRPKMILIASIIPLELLYKDEINIQFRRRISEHINMDLNPWREHNYAVTQEDDDTLEEECIPFDLNLE